MIGRRTAGGGLRIGAAWRDVRRSARGKIFHEFSSIFAGAACRALTARKDGPSLYDVCDPLLLNYRRRRPASRQILPDRARQSGVAAAAAPDRACRIARRAAAAGAARGADPGARRRRRRTGPRSASRSRTCSTPSSCSIPQPKPAAPARRRARPRRDRSRDPRPAARICCARSRSNGFIPTYAAFNLIGDADLRGRELLMALTGPERARLQELDAAVQPGADLHRALAGRAR